MDVIESTQSTRERLIKDLDSVVSDVELLIGGSASKAGDVHDSALDELNAILQRARSSIDAAQRRIDHDVRAAMRAVDVFAHAHAWKLIAVAALGGLVAGLLVGRRQDGSDTIAERNERR